MCYKISSLSGNQQPERELRACIAQHKYRTPSTQHKMETGIGEVNTHVHTGRNKLGVPLIPHAFPWYPVILSVNIPCWLGLTTMLRNHFCPLPDYLHGQYIWLSLKDAITLTSSLVNSILWLVSHCQTSPSPCHRLPSFVPTPVFFHLILIYAEWPYSLISLDLQM